MTEFAEKFVSPFVKPTKEEALKVLNDIREAHPASKGWIEIRGDVEEVPGGYRAVRVHKKYC